jgi:hypothetical protein
MMRHGTRMMRHGTRMMRHGTRMMRRPRRARQRPARAAATVIATVALALLAACSGSPSSAGSGGSPVAEASAGSPSAVAYSACMRAHGVPNYPDPDSDGQLPKTGPQLLGVSSSQYQVAQQDCQHLLPTGGSLQQQEHQCMENSDCPPTLVQQMMVGDLKLARCMRSHGVPNFPDPTNGGPSGPIFNITKSGISDAASHSSQFEAELTECGRLAGANAPESFE